MQERREVSLVADQPNNAWFVDRATAAYLGLAIGDALGVTVASLTAQEIEQRFRMHSKMTGGGWLHLPPGAVSDETEMALALGDSIVAGNGFDQTRAADSLADWMRARPTDVGTLVRRSLRDWIIDRRLPAGPNPGHAEHGAIVRLLPVAIASFGQPEFGVRWAVEQARITHNHPFADAVAIALVQMLHALFAGDGMRGARAAFSAVAAAYPELEPQAVSDKPGAALSESIPVAVRAYLLTDCVRDAILRAVNRGGDADATGALAGMLAGATYGTGGLPRSWRVRLQGAVVDRISAQVIGLTEVARALG